MDYKHVSRTDYARNPRFYCISRESFEHVKALCGQNEVKEKQVVHIVTAVLCGEEEYDKGILEVSNKTEQTLL